MCISPIRIRNPNYGCKPVAGSPQSLKDCTHSYINVPCGVCPECVKLKQLYLVQRVQMEAIDSYLFFATLTYNNEHLPSVTTSSGHTIRFADWHDLQLLFKRMRNLDIFGRPFKYMACSELGSRRGRPHFHVLFFVRKFSSDNEYTPFNLEAKVRPYLLSLWARNIGTRKFPVYESLCTYKEIWRFGKRISNYDFHFVRPLVDEDSFSNVAFYVSKYMLKPSDRSRRLQQALHLNLEEDEYNDIWRLVKSRLITSKGFGLCLDPFGDISDKVLEHIHNSVALSKDFPKFFNPSTGQSFPLSRYYRSKGNFYSLKDALRFYYESNSVDLDSSDNSEALPLSQAVRKIDDFDKLSYEVYNKGDFEESANLLESLPEANPISFDFSSDINVNLHEKALPVVFNSDFDLPSELFPSQ